MIEIGNASVQARILPELGGALGMLQWRGKDILRPAKADCRDVRDTACFPLIPFANRIAYGRFRFDGVDVSLPADGAGAPHALHGFGWDSPWAVGEQSEDRLELKLSHEPRGWPWRYEARQYFALTERGIEIAVSITNVDGRDMPAGLGLHPYFQRSAKTRLTARIDGAWFPDAQGLATIWTAEPVSSHLARGGPVEALSGMDGCCGGWDGEAYLEDGPALVAIRSPAASCLHLYVPPGEDYFCVEPVTHAPDAINRNGVPPMTRLAPGASLSLVMAVEVIAPSG